MFKCQNPDCNQTFEYAGEVRQMALTPVNTPEITKTWRACPYCFSKRIVEMAKEEKADVESVYIYELGLGHQTVLNDLLSQGYKIVNRYAKQYHLEKPKLYINKDLDTIFKEGIREAKLQEVAHQ